MELKVWCDGIQRVICGVTEKTTCQDVVIALAQAMGKTGRYTLVEKWRETERFVSPDERPLAALSKWGEYAGDVQFILRHSDKRSKVGGRRGSARSSGDSQWAGKLYGFSPHSASEPHIPSSTSLRKSLTFSGAHSRSHLLSNHVAPPAERAAEKPAVNGNASSPERLASPADGGVASGSAGSGKPQHRPHSACSRSTTSGRGDQPDRRAVQPGSVPLGHAAGSLERTRRRPDQPSDASVGAASTSAASARTCLGNAVSSVAGTGLSASGTVISVASARTPVGSVITSVAGTKTSVGGAVNSVPNTTTSAESRFASLASTVTSVSSTSASVVNSRTSVGKPYASVANSRTSGSNTATSVTNTNTSLHDRQTSDTASKAFSRLFPRREAQRTSPVREKSTSFPRDIKPVPRESNNNIDFKPNANLTNLSPSVIKDGSPIKDSSISCDNDKEEQKKKSDLLRLVNAQLEQIQKHEDDIRRLETDISLIEHFDHEPVENAKTKEEIARLKKLDYDLDSEIQELELVSWEGKLELELEKEKRLKAEMETVKKNLNNCMAKIEKLNNKIKELNDEITKQKELKNIEEKQAKEQEKKVSAEISELQKQIRKKVAEYEEQEKTISELQAEAKKLEAEIQEKKTKIAELEKELKETNMMSFVRAPTGLLRGSLEGHTFFNRALPSRPSSARRLDSPQGLKEGLSTAKSPHGLWV